MGIRAPSANQRACLGLSPAVWQSQKYKVVTLSMYEAEYITVAMVACQGVWLHRLLCELIVEEARPPTLMVDNQPAIALAKNPVLHDRSKHIYIKCHFLLDCVDGGQIIVEFVKTGRQLADILTKPLGHLRFSELRSKIGMVDFKANDAMNLISYEG